MAAMLSHALSFAALFSGGVYHIIAACKSHLRSHRDYAAQPFHPLPGARRLPLLLAMAALALAALRQAAAAAAAPPSSAARLAAAQSIVVLLLFFLLALSLVLRPLPPDLSFLFAALAFALRSTRLALASDDLPALCDRISSAVAASSSALCLALVVFPRSFALELAMAASVALQGLWSLQTGLSLYADAFIPEGCHRQLEPGAPTLCDLAESRLRAAVALNLALSVHAAVVAVVAAVVYLTVARPAGSYEALPSASSIADSDHVQMKIVGKSAMQA
ncbi:plant viral-response family protein (DUF716) [Wolffia australiana]